MTIFFRFLKNLNNLPKVDKYNHRTQKKLDLKISSLGDLPELL